MNLEFVCANGCGVCKVRLSDFEYQRTETIEGELLDSKTHPVIVSACCGADVDVWDERAQDVTGHVRVDRISAILATPVEGVSAAPMAGVEPICPACSQPVEKTPQETDRDWLVAQQWKGMDGAIAWHLIYRHADGWGDTGAMMNAWLEANREWLAAPLDPQAADVAAQEGRE